MNIQNLGIDPTIIAIYAAVVSTVVLVWDIIKHLRDKPNLKIEAKWVVFVGTQDAIPRVSITMVNTGSKPLTIVECGFKIAAKSDSNQATVLDSSLPKELTPGQRHVSYADFDAVTKLKVRYAWVHDATGKEYRSKRNPLRQ